MADLAGVTNLRHWDPRAAGAQGAQGAQSESDFTVFFLHHAGGSAVSYARFVRHLPRQWRLRALELPARMTSPDELPCRGTAEAVGALVPTVRGEVRAGYAVFGHSMGALVAYELVRELERQQLPPVWLGLSGSPAPVRIGNRVGAARRDLWSRERLIEFMRGLGGTPEEVFQVPDLVDCMVRALRADLAIVDTYRHVEGAPLDTPVSVFSGESDPTVSAGDVGLWRDYCRAPVLFHSWPGGHFYLFDHVNSVSARISQDVKAAQG